MLPPLTVLATGCVASAAYAAVCAAPYPNGRLKWGTCDARQWVCVGGGSLATKIHLYHEMRMGYIRFQVEVNQRISGSSQSIGQTNVRSIKLMSRSAYPLGESLVPAGPAGAADAKLWS